MSDILGSTVPGKVPASPTPPGTTLKDKPVQPAYTQPGLYMIVNGYLTDGLKSFTVTRTNNYSPDTWSCEIAMNAIGNGYGATYWAGQSNIEINLMAAIGGAPAISAVLGLVDEVNIDLATGTLSLKGRDYASQFVENKTSEKFANQTSSQVVTTLAKRRGLNPIVTATTTLVGKYYAQDSALVTNSISEWTLMKDLALKEHFDLFVQGINLYFQPAANPQTSTIRNVIYRQPPYVPASNVEKLKMMRALTVAKDVKVTVTSHSHEHKTSVKSSRKKSASAGRSVAKAAPQLKSNAPTNYNYRVPGLTQEQADKFAEARLLEISKHERKIEFEMPADIFFTPRQLIKLTGTGTDFDQVYYPTDVMLRCGWNEGYCMTVHAKNSSPQTITDPAQAAPTTQQIIKKGKKTDQSVVMAGDYLNVG